MGRGKTKKHGSSVAVRPSRMARIAAKPALTPVALSRLPRLSSHVLRNNGTSLTLRSGEMYLVLHSSLCWHHLHFFSVYVRSKLATAASSTSNGRTLDVKIILSLHRSQDGTVWLFCRDFLRSDDPSLTALCGDRKGYLGIGELVLTDKNSAVNSANVVCKTQSVHHCNYTVANWPFCSRRWRPYFQ